MDSKTAEEMTELIDRLRVLENFQRAFANAIRPADAHVADTALGVAAGLNLARDVVSGVPF